MKSEVKLKFLELVFSTEDNLCTCILVDVSSDNRKIFLTLTQEEGRMVKNIIDEKNKKIKKQCVQQVISNNVKNFVKNKYTIESAKIDVSVSGAIGSLILRKKHEKFNLLAGVFTVILLMLGENISVFTSEDSLAFCSIHENLCCDIKHNMNNSKSLLEKLDFFIEQENCKKLKEICKKMRDSEVDIRLLVKSV